MAHINTTNHRPQFATVRYKIFNVPEKVENPTEKITICEIEKEYENVAKLCLECGAYDVLISDTDERNESIWSARGTFLEIFKVNRVIDECDVVVLRDKVAQFIRYTHDIQKEVGLRIKSFNHAGDGNLHVYPRKDDLLEEEWRERLSKDFVFF